MTVSPPHHACAFRVYYEDTDAAGIVYYANYLRFAERARTEMLRAAGLDHLTLERRYGLRFAVRRCCAEYVRPARLDDLLRVETRVDSLSGARLVMRQRILVSDAPACELQVDLVLLDGNFRPVRVGRALPAEVLLRLGGCAEGHTVRTAATEQRAG